MENNKASDLSGAVINAKIKSKEDLYWMFVTYFNGLLKLTDKEKQIYSYALMYLYETKGKVDDGMDKFIIDKSSIKKSTYNTYKYKLKDKGLFETNNIVFTVLDFFIKNKFMVFRVEMLEKEGEEEEKQKQGEQQKDKID